MEVKSIIQDLKINKISMIMKGLYNFIKHCCLSNSRFNVQISSELYLRYVEAFILEHVVNF